MLRLQPFTTDDIQTHLSWLQGTDARFLLQYSGPVYHYPLDRKQLLAELEKMASGGDLLMFKALEEPSNEVIGHIQLLNIDPEEGKGTLGRVLLRKDKRGLGLGKVLVNNAVDHAFRGLGLNELRLSVYTFNTPAIRCYRRIGFKVINQGFYVFPGTGERWGRLVMSLRKEDQARSPGAILSPSSSANSSFPVHMSQEK